MAEAYKIIRSASLPALGRGGDTTGLVSSEGKSIVSSAIDALARFTALPSVASPAASPAATPAAQTAGEFIPTVPASPSQASISASLGISDPDGYHSEAVRIIRTAKTYYKQRLLDEKEIDGAPDGGDAAYPSWHFHFQSDAIIHLQPQLMLHFPGVVHCFIDAVRGAVHNSKVDDQICVGSLGV